SIKVARGYFKGSRQYIIGFLGAFHGRTMGAASITASKPVQRKWFSPLVPGVIHVPYPYSYRCPFKSETPEECGDSVLEYIEDWILSKIVDPSEVAAFIVEPIQGEGGYIVPPDNFLPGLRKLADEHGILLITDEVQSGVGRTGKWYAVEHWNVEPDIITSAKGIASGLPLGVIAGKAKVMSLPPGSHASTFGGNPVSLAAAEAVIDVIKEENLLENAARQGEYIMKRFRELMDSIELIGEVRGKGLMIGVELVKNRDTKEPAKKEMSWIINNAFKRGLLVISAGVSTLRIAPPLIITREEADKGIEILEGLLREASRSA
ncbi:MAG: aminotransferase class III-fold pyridoxal phosphate-dependent enzyme, partial [Desulfurococcales archaeon]|nr:aminotransferase class III-fold pyridoxal phosphate-dependent enzyme [Desulfurococcales archaeon]